MNDIHKKTTFPNRDFIAMVRAELAAMGRPDVIVERSWIDEDEPGYPFLLRVPVGTELTVPLKAMDGFFHTRTEKDRKWYAVEFATALANLKSAETMLIKYARDVRRAANSAVAAVRREAAAAGIVGWIDGTATLILDASGLELRRLVELLRRTAIVELSGTIGDRLRLRVEMRWRDGIISGTLKRQQDGVSYMRGLLKMTPSQVPATLMTALPGRRLDALLTHPLIPTDPTIREIRESWDGLHVTVDEAVTPITPPMLQTP